MTLARETCGLVAAAYGLGLVFEDVRDASDAPGGSPFHQFQADIVARTDELGRFRGTTELVERVSRTYRLFWGGPPVTKPAGGWERQAHKATEVITHLQKEVAARVGRRLRDQLDALLILLLVEQRERGRQKIRPATEFGPWIGLNGPDMLEVISARALHGFVHVEGDSLRLSIDGRLVAESLLAGDAEPATTLQAGSVRRIAAPSRIEGMIERLEIRNVFSFGDDAESIEFGRLNLLIGANGSGKSNLLEAIELLASTPRDVQAAVREAGGIYDVLSRRTKQEGLVGSVEAGIRFTHRDAPMRHTLRFAAEEQRFVIVDEVIGFLGLTGSLGVQHTGGTRSMLDEFRDPEHADLAAFYEAIRSYREPLLGRLAAPRTPQATDLPTDQLLADGSNLALMLSKLRLDPPRMRSIVEKLQDVYASVTDIETKTEGGTIQVFLQDGGFPLSARRISDGTMRFLCLLVVLSSPSPPPVVLIEEPELGLHPDAIGALADLLREASERMQLIVTTHSEALVDRFSDTPEAVLVVDKAEPAEGGSTRVKRLDKEELKEWLEAFSLGRLWRMGEIGGNRW